MSEIKFYARSVTDPAALDVNVNFRYHPDVIMVDITGTPWCAKDAAIGKRFQAMTDKVHEYRIEGMGHIDEPMPSVVITDEDIAKALVELRVTIDRLIEARHLLFTRPDDDEPLARMREWIRSSYNTPNMRGNSTAQLLSTCGYRLAVVKDLYVLLQAEELRRLEASLELGESATFHKYPSIAKDIETHAHLAVQYIANPSKWYTWEKERKTITSIVMTMHDIKSLRP